MPKKTSATKFKYFRSIACCNVFYKCVTKIITTKLADCLPEAISNRTIVEGRQIGDNILMAHELLLRISGRRSPMLLRLGKEDCLSG
ncbi:hypothetical protein LINPERPRIM_LOCUS4979 [Linum perenne]